MLDIFLEKLKELICTKETTTIKDWKYQYPKPYKKMEVNENTFEYIDKIIFFRNLSINDNMNSNRKERLKKFEQEAFNLFVTYIELSKCTSEIEVAVIGNFSSGKSMFINSFLGDEVCPVDNKATTSSVTKFYFSPVEEIFINNQKSNRANYVKVVRHKGVGENTKINTIEYGYPSILFSNIILYDSPGFGNPSNKNDESETLKLFANMDVILYVIDINNGDIKSEELKILEKLKSDRKMLFCILNKSDSKSPSAINKIKKQIESHNIFDDVVDYSSLNILKALKDNHLKNTIDNIEKNLIPNEENFEINIKGEQKKGRRKSFYQFSINNKSREIHYTKAIEKRDEIIAILNRINAEKKHLLDKIFKQDKRRFEFITKEFLDKIISDLSNKKVEDIDITNFEDDVNNIFEHLKAYEENILKSLKYRVIQAYKDATYSIAVSDNEKSFSWSSYHKIKFDDKIFWDSINGNFKDEITKYILHIQDEVNPLLIKYSNFELNINYDILKSNELIIQILGGWYKNLGGFWQYNRRGDTVYFDEEHNANYAIKNTIYIQLDELIDNEIEPILIKNLYTANESGIIQVQKSFEKEQGMGKEANKELIKEIKQYQKEQSNVR